MRADTENTVISMFLLDKTYHFNNKLSWIIRWVTDKNSLIDRVWKMTNKRLVSVFEKLDWMVSSIASNEAAIRTLD